MLQTLVGTDSSAELLDLLPAAIYRTDAQGVITYFNPAAARLWGAEPQLGVSEFCGPWKLFWPDGRFLRHDECPMALALRDGKPHHGMEAAAVRSDGSRVEFMAYPTPIFARTGELIGAVNMLVDITNKRRDEIDQERLAAIVNGSDDAIISKNLSGTITSWNPGAVKVFGYEAAEAIGQSITILIPEEQLDEEPRILAQIRQGNHVDHYETIRRRKDGTLINISLTVSPIRAADGRIIGASKIARDITEGKRQQQQQLLLVREMRHRIKNTLSTVQSIATQTLADLDTGHLDAFRARLAALAGVHDLLTQDNWQGTTLDAVVREALRPFQDTYGSRIEVRCDEISVMPDFAQTLALVMHELATNAVKYGALSNEAGRISVTGKSGHSGATLTWEEAGGPPVAVPDRTGFGSKLLKRALVERNSSLEFRPEGVVFVVSI